MYLICKKVPNSAETSISNTLVDLLVKVERLLTVGIQPGAIRVPLDIHRPERPTRQWQSLTLTENRVSANVELIAVLEDCQRMQQHVGGALPLLVDEKVHYAVMRMMHSPLLGDLHVTAWLQHIPLLYGVWHPYKQCVTVVYRTFLPVFSLLECTGRPSATGLKPKRKLLYLEKMVASLLLCARDITPLAAQAMQTASTAAVHVSVSARSHLLLFVCYWYPFCILHCTQCTVSDAAHVPSSSLHFNTQYG